MFIVLSVFDWVISETAWLRSPAVFSFVKFDISKIAKVFEKAVYLRKLD